MGKDWWLDCEQFVAPVSAKRPTVTDFGDYNYIVGRLGRADYGLFMPENNWNGMLIVLCRGHSREVPEIPSPPFEQRPLSMGVKVGTKLMNIPVNGKRFAFAWSNYGQGRYCIKTGVIQTHQLTQYLVNQHNVPGKVFLISASMGGAIGLTLAEKYPNLYSGVLDLVGVKDLAASYAHKAAIASLVESLNQRVNLVEYFEGPPASIDPLHMPHLTDSSSPDYWDDTEVSDYIHRQGLTAKEIEEECGGTPDEIPKAYERRSPICNPEISVPVIIVHATDDTQVPYSQSVAYCNAVNEATQPDLCRLYDVVGAGHLSIGVYSQIIRRLFELVSWSNMIDP